MSEQHEHRAESAASGEPEVPPPPLPLSGTPEPTYGVGPVTFAGIPLVPTAAAETPHDPLPLDLEPLKLATDPATEPPAEPAVEAPVPEASPASARPSHLSLEEWLAAAPVKDLTALPRIHQPQADTDELGRMLEEEAAASPSNEAVAGRPLDVAPIVAGITPTTEHDRREPLAEAAELTGDADTASTSMAHASSESSEPMDPPELFDLAAPGDAPGGEPPAESTSAIEEVSFDTWEPGPTTAVPAPEAARTVPAEAPPVEVADEPPSGIDGMTVAEVAMLDHSTPLPHVAPEPIAARAPALAAAAENSPMSPGVAGAESPAAIVGETAAPPAAIVSAAAAADAPTTVAAEPTPAELASIPPEKDAAVALPAVAAGALVTSADAPETVHEQTATEVFAHAHEDVEARRGFLSHGVLTKFAGLVGLVVCISGLVLMLAACAGLTPLSSEKLLAFNGYLMWGVIGMAVVLALQITYVVLSKNGTLSAVQTGIVTLLVAALWGGIAMFHDRVAGIDLLKEVSPWLVKIAGGGLAVALIGGFIEHRRMREETHVLAAVFTNVLAGLGGLALWMVQEGYKLFPGK